MTDDELEMCCTNCEFSKELNSRQYRLLMDHL